MADWLSRLSQRMLLYNAPGPLQTPYTLTLATTQQLLGTRNQLSCCTATVLQLRKLIICRCSKLDRVRPLLQADSLLMAPEIRCGHNSNADIIIHTSESSSQQHAIRFQQFHKHTQRNTRTSTYTIWVGTPLSFRKSALAPS